MNLENWKSNMDASQMQTPKFAPAGNESNKLINIDDIFAGNEKIANVSSFFRNDISLRTILSSRR